MDHVERLKLADELYRRKTIFRIFVAWASSDLESDFDEEGDLTNLSLSMDISRRMS